MSGLDQFPDGPVVRLLDAHWEALANWPSLDKAFQRKFDSDLQMEGMLRSGVAEADVGSTAAISIKTVPLNITAGSSIAVQWPIGIQVNIYTGLGKYRYAWRLLQQVINAIYAAKPDANSSRTFVEAATCGPPQSVVQVNVDTLKIPSIGTVANPRTWLVGTATFMFLSRSNPFNPPV